MSRSSVIQVWFAAVVLVISASIAFRVSFTVSTGAMLLALSLVPPAIVFKLWPRPPARTTADMLYPRDPRR
jgi:hypothetical protein